MVQIAFLTFFLGLTTGVQPVELSVAGPAAAVLLELDGVPVGDLTGPPWVQQVDFGRGLLPHELVARALDASGVEIARARQWMNLPRPFADVALVLEGDDLARPTGVRLAWETFVVLPPPRISLTLDGKRLRVGRDGRAALPAQDSDLPHLLSARLDFGGGIEARRDVVFGAYGSDAAGELTAVAVRGPLPEPQAMEGWFTAGGKPLRPVAVDQEVPQVALTAQIETAKLLAAFNGVDVNGFRRTPWARAWRFDLAERALLLWPWPQFKASSSGKPVEMFDYTLRNREGSAELTSMLGELAGAEYSRAKGDLYLADGVMAAGLVASAGNRPRAVVLVLGGGREDASFYDPATVRRYLAALRVPLHVWSLLPRGASPAAAAWGGAVDVSSPSKLLQAIARLREDLGSQHIVFFEGLHLPQRIEVTSAAPSWVELP